MDGLLGGFIGSVITVIVTKIIDIIQKSQEHKYELQKHFFQIKLESGRKAISNLYSLSSNLQGYISLFESIAIVKGSIDSELYNLINNNLQVQIEKLKNSVDILDQSFILFYEIDDDFFDDDGKYTKLIINLNDVISMLRLKDFLFEYIKGLSNDEKEKIIDFQKSLDVEIRKKFLELSDTYKDARKQIIALISHMRNEMSIELKKKRV